MRYEREAAEHGPEEGAAGGALHFIHSGGGLRLLSIASFVMFLVLKCELNTCFSSTGVRQRVFSRSILGRIPPCHRVADRAAAKASSMPFVSRSILRHKAPFQSRLG